MANYVISPDADHDIESILAWTHEQFGAQARLRYEMLLVRAMLDLAEDPQRAGSHDRSEIATAARTYHLWHSRDRVHPKSDRVHRPRHFLLFRIGASGRIEVGRVLHDSMDIARHLPAEYGPPGTEEESSE